LPGYYAGTVVLDNNSEYIPGYPLYTDIDIGENFSLFAGIKGVINCFLDGCDNTSRGGVKPQQVLIFLEEFCDADTPLGLGKFIREDHSLPPRGLQK